MEFKGTKGKWEVCWCQQNSIREAKYPYANAPIARCFDDTIDNTGQALANAKLMAKSPEMLEMLEECLDTFQCEDSNDRDLKRRIEQLIKEATSC